MKIPPALRIGSVLLISCLLVNARDTALRYKFSAGQTNAYAVEVAVRSENGSEIITGNLVVVTKEASTNGAKIVCRGNLKLETKRTPQRGPNFYGNYMPMQTLNAFQNGCELDLDERGQVIRDGGDYLLAVPLGKLVQSIFEPLPAKSGTVESADFVAALDEPLWLGPTEFLLSPSRYGPPYYGGFMGFNPQQGQQGALKLARRTAWSTTTSSTDSVIFKKKVSLESLLKTGGEPRLTASSESVLTFNRAAGVFEKIETVGDVSSQTETASRKAKVSLKCHLLSGAELAAVLNPPPPPAPRKLAGADLEKFVADLKSPELETRRAALRQFNGAEVESPSPELVDLVAALALDSDQFTRMTAANFLGAHATTNQVPVLLKLLKDTDYSSRQPAIKALGRLKDERAIQPLADLVARGSSMYGQEAGSALMNFGASAEKAALALLNERNADTLRQACTILQQIGTGDSLEPVQKLVADSDQQVSQAAVDALRAIQQRR